MGDNSSTYKWGIPWGYNPLILTIDPNFLGHPSTVDGKNPAPVEVGSLSQAHLQGFIHPRRCRIPPINSMSVSKDPDIPVIFGNLIQLQIALHSGFPGTFFA